MIEMQTVKFINVSPAKAVSDNATIAAAEIDTLGWSYLTYVFAFGAMDIAMAAMKVTHSDAAGSGHVDLAGADFSVAPATLPASTDDDTLSVAHINLVGKKRYFDLVLTSGDGAVGTYLAVVAILSRGDEAATTAALQGASQRLVIV